MANVFTDNALTIWVSGLLLAVSLTSAAAVVTKQELDSAADGAARIISEEGAYNPTDVQAFLRKTGVNGTVTFSADNGDGNMQLGDGFSVSISKAVRIGAGNIGFTVLTLIGKSAGESEVYKK